MYSISPLLRILAYQNVKAMTPKLQDIVKNSKCLCDIADIEVWLYDEDENGEFMSNKDELVM